MPRVSFFEIAVDQPARAKKFYESVFGWKMAEWPGQKDYWLIGTSGKMPDMTGAMPVPADEPGIDGALLPRRMPSESTTVTITVPDADKFTAKAVQAGGKVLVPKVAVTGVGWLVYLQDTEGNVFGILQPDMAAK